MYNRIVDARSIERFHRSLETYKSSGFIKLLSNPFKQLYPKFFNAYLRRAKKTQFKIAETFWGDKMKVVLPGFYSTIIYKYGFVEEYLITYMLNYLKVNDIFIDIGAHYGFFSLLASKIVGPGGKVYCFEPTPSTYDILSENIKNKNNIVSNNCLLWSIEKELVFRDYGPAYSEINSVYNPRMSTEESKKVHYNEFKIQAYTIDNYVKQNGLNPNFIKIDAESAEMEILTGMAETIAIHEPIIAIEIGDYNVENVPASVDLISFLTSRGYKPYEYTEDCIKEHKIKETYNYQVLLFVKNNMNNK